MHLMEAKDLLMIGSKNSPKTPKRTKIAVNPYSYLPILYLAEYSLRNNYHRKPCKRKSLHSNYHIAEYKNEYVVHFVYSTSCLDSVFDLHTELNIVNDILYTRDIP